MHSSESLQSESLNRAVARLGTLGVVPAVATELRARSAATGETLAASIVSQIPAYTETANPAVLPELAAHGRAHIDAMQQLLSGDGPADFGFVLEHARQRAEQRFPLEASLHAYRSGHRVLARWVRDAAAATLAQNSDREQMIAAVADFAIEYTDHVSNLLTAEYVAQTRAIAEAESSQRDEVLDILLKGYDESDGRVAGILRRSGYLQQRQSYCIAVAQSVDPREMSILPRARRVAESLAEALRPLSLRILSGIRDDIAILVCSDTRRQSGWTVPRAELAARLDERLLRIGPTVLIGISSDVPATAMLPRALAEARQALDVAGVERRVVSFSDLPLSELLLAGVPESLHRAMPAWTDALLAANTRSRGVLIDTLRAYADADMNVRDTARRLDVHANTVYLRMQKVADATGLDPFRYHALSELLLAARLRASPRQPG